MSTELITHSLDEIERMAQIIARSGLFGIKTTEQAAALMLIAQAENIHPVCAARDYHIIQGRPALKADAMLSRFQKSGGKVTWKEISDERVAAVFSHPQSGEVSIDWTMERAKRAGLAGRDMWKTYPRQMLRARVISEGIRTAYPGVLDGFYTPEECSDMPPVLLEKDITPTPWNATLSGSQSHLESTTAGAPPAPNQKQAQRTLDADDENAPSTFLLRLALCTTADEVRALKPMIAKMPQGEERKEAISLCENKIAAFEAGQAETPRDEAQT